VGDDIMRKEGARALLTSKKAEGSTSTAE